MANVFEEKMKAYLALHIPAAEHMAFEQSCHSVAEAAEAANADTKDLVKNVCMIDADNNLIVAIVHGPDRASTSRVAKALDCVRPRLATADEILHMSGYPCGGTSSFGFAATFLVDPRVAERETVITGGGSEKSLVGLKIRDLLAANNAQIVRVRK